MRIPVSPGQQVQQAPMSGYQPQSTAIRAPSVAGALGEALGQVSEAQHFANNLRTEDAFNQGLAEAQKIKAEAGQQLGANVRPDKFGGKTFTENYTEQLDKSLSGIEEGLANSNQKVMFQRKAALLRQSVQSDLQAHEARETRADSVGVNQSTIDLSTSDAIRNLGNPMNLAMGQIRIDGAIKDNAKLLGWSPEQTQVEHLKAMTSFHGSVVTAAVEQGKVGYAKDYLAQHGDDLEAGVKLKLDKLVGSASEDETSLDIARQGIDLFKSSGQDYGKAYDLVSKLAGKDKGVLDKALAELGHAASVFKDQKGMLDDKDEASIMKMVMDKQPPSKILSAIPLLTNLDDKGKVALQQKVLSFYRGTAEDRTAAREDRKEAQSAALLRYQLNPNLVWQMSEDQLTNLYGDLGASGVSKLIEMKQGMQKQGPVTFQVDADYFNKVATDAGFNLKDVAHNARLLDAKSKIENQIAQEQAANKQHPNQKLAPERRNEITRYWLADVLTKGTGGMFGDDTVKRKRYEVINPQDIVASIPPAHMGGIVSYLEEQSRRAGRKQSVSLADLTPDEIVELETQLFPVEK